MNHAAFYNTKVRNWYWCSKCEKYYKRPSKKAWVYSLSTKDWVRHRLTYVGTDRQRTAHERKRKK